MLDVVVAALPIVLFVLLLTVARLSSAKAALACLLCAVATGLFYFGGAPERMGWEGLKGVWNAFTVFTVIAPAILIYELLLKSGMFVHMKARVEAAIADDLLRVLLIGWVFTSFLQSITGFGVPVAVAAPILVSLGVKPLKSVVICIVGHAWGGTFGTLALAWDSLFLQVPQAAGYANLTLYTGLLLWAYNLICGVVICCLYRGRLIVRGRDLVAVVVLSMLQGGGQLLFTAFSTTTACFMGTVLAMAGVFLLNRYLYGVRRGGVLSSGVPVWHMVFPFGLLTALVVVVLFLPPVHSALGQWRVGLTLPQSMGGGLYAPIAVLTHSGTLLLAAGLGALGFYRKRGYLDQALAAQAVRGALGKACASILPILLLIVMSKIMDGTGQIGVLAEGIAGVLGAAYPLFAPFVGILGAFISSSNMSSNILFAGFQSQVALLLGLDPGAILAAQTVGGSVGNLTATSNIVLGLATTGEAGKEGRVMAMLLPVALLCGLACGGLTLLFCALGPS